MQQQPNATTPQVDENGNVLPASEQGTDDSFGEQMILKDQPRVPSFSIGAGSSLYYTNNVALTRRDTRDDAFLVANAFGNWVRRVHPELELQAGVGVSIFRYNRTSQLDFNQFNAGLGLTWLPQRWPGVSLFARYDFTELLNRHATEILNDHQFLAGGQKTFVFGRSHALFVGALASAGISDPGAAQRDQAGVFAGYHLQVTRHLGTDVLYRLTGQFYNEGGRDDLNHVFSWNLSYRIGNYTEVGAYFSFSSNQSNKSVFDYNVISTGGGLGFSSRF